MLSELSCDYHPSEFRVKHATLDWESTAAYQLRRDVFCHEQGIFLEDDRDAIDETAQLLVALACLCGMPDQVVGTVRIHQEASGRWWGSRLAVHENFRKRGNLGAALIRLAVSSANAIGCDTFLAHVQSQNVPLFRRLRWESLEEETLRGRPHNLMRANLDAYPPFHEMKHGFVTQGRRP